MSLGKAPVAQNIQVVTDAVNQILQDKLATILTEFYTTEQQLRVQKEGLQEKLEKQLIEIQVSKVDLEKAKKELENSQNENTLHLQDLSNALSTNITLTSTVEEQRRSNLEMQERNESLVCELKQVRQLHTDTERTAQSLNTRLEERMQVVEASSQKIAELSLQISRLEEENGQISSSHASLQEQHRDALDTLRSTKQERDDLQQQLIKEHEKLHNSERILAQLKDDLESANQNVRALEEQSRFQADRIKDLEHQISATNCRLGTLDELRAKETASLNKVIDSLNVELQVHQATAKKLSSQIRELEETRSAQTQEIERRENERQDLTSRLEDSKGREQLAVEHSRTLTEELATEVFDLKQALAQERRNLELASLREDSLTKQNEARSLELSDKVHTMMHLRSDLEASEVRYSELETRYRTDLEKHKRDLEERERARLEFEATFDQLRQELSLEKENSKKQKEHCEEAETREAETQKTQEELISRVTHFKEAVTTLERELDATKQEVIKYEQLLTLTTGAKNEVSAELSRISELLLYAEREVAEYKEQVFALQREKAGLVESMQVEREYFELEISRYQTTSEEQLENRLRAEIEGREEVISAMRQREEEMEEKLSEYAALQEKVLQLEIEREQSGPVLPNEAFDFPDILFADDDIPQENEHDGDVNFALALLEAGQAAQVPTVIPRPKKSRQLREEEPSNKRQRISPSTYKHRSPKSDRTTIFEATVKEGKNFLRSAGGVSDRRSPIFRYVDEKTRSPYKIQKPVLVSRLTYTPNSPPSPLKRRPVTQSKSLDTTPKKRRRLNF